MARLPNILVTGTPGTGKTSMCEMLAVRVSISLSGESHDPRTGLTRQDS
jgi:Holliday junction resolvasome RuvABC ATP-dependent DNA helicase subunit